MEKQDLTSQIEGLMDNKDLDGLKSLFNDLNLKIGTLESKINGFEDDYEYENLLDNFETSFGGILTLAKKIGIKKELSNFSDESMEGGKNTKEKFEEFFNEINEKYNHFLSEEIKNLSNILNIQTSEEDFSNPEKKSEILKEIIKTISSLKENFSLIQKGNINSIKTINLFISKFLVLSKELDLEAQESDFESFEGSQEVFDKILEKIKELIENFSKGGEKELDKKDEEIKKLSNLINKIKGEKNYLSQNKKSLESENDFLQEKKSDLIISKQNFELQNSNNGEENEILNSQIGDLSRDLKLSESEIQILKGSFDEVLDEKIGLEKIIGILEKKLTGEKNSKETLIGVVNNLSEESNKISKELKEIKAENLDQKETIKNQQSEISKQAEDVLNKNGKITKLNKEIKKIRNDNLISDEVKKKRISELEGKIKRLKKESQVLGDENLKLKDKIEGFEKDISDLSNNISEKTFKIKKSVKETIKNSDIVFGEISKLLKK